MKIIITEICILVIGMMFFVSSSLVLASWESNVIEIEYKNQSSYKLDKGKHYVYLDDVIQYENYSQSENQGVITTDIKIGGTNFSEDLSISIDNEIVHLTPELNESLKNEIFGGYLYASFEVGNEDNYDINILTTNTDGSSATYNPSFIITSVNPNLPIYFEWVQSYSAYITLIGMFVFGMIYVIKSKK